MSSSNSGAEAGAGADGPPLQRSIGMVQMAFYGLGSMLGAGLYALMRPEHVEEDDLAAVQQAEAAE